MNNKDQKNIRGLISSYLAVDLGMFTNQDEIDTKYNQVINWWKDEK